VSLNGSPTVSLTTPALWASDPRRRGSPGSDVHALAIVGLSPPLQKPWYLPRLPADFVDHALGILAHRQNPDPYVGSHADPNDGGRDAHKPIGKIAAPRALASAVEAVKVRRS